MPNISEVVNVNISRETTAVSRAAFGVMMHLSLTRVFDSGETWREYTSAAALISDGFKTTDTAYLAASKYFAQEVSPTKMIVGQRKTADTVTITPTVANSTVYNITINGTLFSFTSDGTATAGEICAGLIAAINASPEPVTASGTTTVILNPDVATTYYSVTVTSNLSVAYTAGQTITQDIAAIRETNDTWYALTAHTHAQADVEEIAGVIETLKKIYGYSTADAGVYGSGTTDVMSVLKSANYARSFGIYDAEADTTFPEAAWLGVMLPKDPGSATWKFKTLVGIDQDNLTPTQSTYVRGKNGNTYETIGGVDVTREGVMADAEFIDTIHGCDWLEARMEERIYSRLVNSDKIPYTDAGAAVLEAEIRSQLQEGIEAGFLAASPAPTVTIPRVATISSANKIAREFPTITFEATLAGAIHKVTINGTVTV